MTANMILLCCSSLPVDVVGVFRQLAAAAAAAAVSKELSVSIHLLLEELDQSLGIVRSILSGYNA